MRISRPRFLTIPNAIASVMTFTAATAVALWAARPVDGIEYRLGSDSQSREVLSPTYVPLLAEGFSSVEPWGRWTAGPKAAVTFGRPLPRHITLSLVAHAFGPNVGAPVRLCVAEDCKAVVLGREDREVRASFETRHPARRLVIHVPHPTAPGNGDERPLGVGVVSIKVEEARR